MVKYKINASMSITSPLIFFLQVMNYYNTLNIYNKINIVDIA